jgi:hypothetical protein
MPARPKQRKKKPFAPQSALKYPRTMSRLWTYAKRRMAYSICTVIVLCVFFSRYMEEIRKWRAEQRRIAARPSNKLRQRKCRKLKKIQARIARLRECRARLAQDIAQLQAKITRKAFYLRTHATDHAGHIDGWTAATPKTDAELKAESWSRRYRAAYAQSAAEKVRITELMAKQQAKPLVQPRTITL